MADSSVNYPTLSGMFNSISPVPAMMGQMQFQQALSQAKQNQQMQSDEMRMKQEMHPLEMLFKQAQTGQTNANTGLINEQTIGTKFKNQMDADTRQAQLDNLLSKYAKEKSANELQVAEDSINKTLLDDRIPPEQRQKLLQLSQFFQKTREKQQELTSQRETAESVATIQGNTSRDVARIGADAGIQRAQIASNARSELARINGALKAGKMTKNQAFVEYNRLAAMETDPEKKALYQALADQAEMSDRADKQAAANAVPQVDPSKVPGAPLTTPQPPTPTPRGNTAPSASGINKQVVEAAGWAYEPDKYDYRVMDGKVQRKPKGK